MYGDIHFGPKQLPWIAPDTPWAPTAPYYGEELAYLTSMTPFRSSDFVPVVQQSGVPTPLNFDLGGTAWGTWLQDTLSNVGGAAGIKQGLKRGIGPGDPAVIKLQNGLELLGYSVGSQGADGWFMGATDKALRAFQVSKGLPSTGETDKETTKALNRTIALKVGVANLPTFPAGTPGPLPPAPVPTTYSAGASAPMTLGTGGKIAIAAVLLGLVGWAVWPRGK